MKYEIFDSYPAQSGDVRWPEGAYSDGAPDANHFGDADALAEAALAWASAEARGCPDYEPGDRLWVIVWDDAGTIAAEASRAIHED